MKTDRLNVLADYLDTVPAEAFDMGVWYEDGRDCGYAACALGHACLIQEFRDAGLHLDGTTPAVEVGVLFTGFSAAEVFFDIGHNDARRLFAFESYPSIPRAAPAQVAARIRELIASAA